MRPRQDKAYVVGDGASSTGAAVLELAALKESKLQKAVIEPLLSALGFSNITDTSGPRERGKDLVALKSNDFGRIELYSIQIKRWKSVAKAADSHSFGKLLTQLGQAIKEPVLNPNTREKQKPNKCLFFTPFPVSSRAEEDYQSSLLEAFNAGVEIIDGPRIVELLLKHSPSTLGTFSTEVQYRLRLAGTVTQIPEARTAFEGTSNLDLLRIYVEVAVVDDVSIDELAQSLAAKRKVKASTGQIRRLTRLIANITDVAEGGSIDVSPPQQEDNAEPATDVQLQPVLAPLVTFLRRYKSDRVALRSTESSSVVCTNVAKTSARVKHGLDRLKTNTIVRKILTASDFRADEHEALSIPLKMLLRIDSPVLILGGPGAGKSTALRWLCHSAAQRHDEPLPIFVSLATVKTASTGAILEACAQQLQEAGYYSTQTNTRVQALEQKLKQGSVRLLLDGLDEAGSGAEALLRSIDDLSKEYPRAPIVLSCRDTLGLDIWKKAFVLRLLAFDDAQIGAFIRHWFNVESRSEELIAWLQRKPKMREAARTPLIAALLCSLFELQADMPSTEVDLYERRFELLLGRWEQAKGLVPLSPQARRSYLKMLEALAFFLHRNERRHATTQEAKAFVKQFVFPGMNWTRAELVEDCVRRGVLERQYDGNLSLGHLTYQEYLAACLLLSRNEVGFIWKHLTIPWWRKALEFYAAKSADITSVLKTGLLGQCDATTMCIVDELVKLAPFTSKTVLNRLRSLSITPHVLRSATVRDVDTIDLD